MANNNNNKNLNVPNLRFKEFSGEWKKYNVSDLLDFYSTNSLSWDQLDYNNGDILNLHYGLIHKGLSTMVDLKSDLLPFIKETNVPRSYTLCKIGDVAFADASEDTNDVAKVVEFLDCDNKPVICGLHTIHGRDNKDITVPGYKGYAFASSLFHKQIRRIAQGTKIYSINTRNFDETVIGIPSKPEQEKIVNLLFAIDNRIATQNKIIEDLKKLKFAIYLTIFEREKADIISLGSVCEIVKGKQVNGELLSETGAYYVMNGGIVPSGYYHDYNIDPNTISISEGGNSCGYVQFNNERFWSGGHCYTLQKISPQTNTLYLYHFLKYREDAIMKLRIGSGLPNIQKKDLVLFKILLPGKERQTQLSQAFNGIDLKCKIENSLLRTYEKQKKYLLQQMFT